MQLHYFEPFCRCRCSSSPLVFNPAKPPTGFLGFFFGCLFCHFLDINTSSAGILLWMARGIFELQINNLEFQFVLYSPKFSKVTYCQAGAASLTESVWKSRRQGTRSGVVSKSLLFIMAEGFLTWGNRHFLLLLSSFSLHVHDKQESRWTLKKQRYFFNANLSSNSE